MDFKSPATRLDVDESILSRKLKINSAEDDFQQLLNAAFADQKFPSNEALPYKLVKPKAGFCVKTRNIISSQKVFINICHTDVIPQPVDINESDLIKILESDEPSTFRVPMSIGECHEEVDKSGQSCSVYDIAINSTFLPKVEGNLLFQTFLVTAAMEGMEDKYNIELDKNGWTTLRNRKCFGTIQNHRIEQREEKPAVQEIPKPSQLEKRKKVQPLVEENTDVSSSSKPGIAIQPTPRVALAKSHEGAKFLIGLFPIMNAGDLQGITLFVGEYNIVIQGVEASDILNVKLPYRISPSKTRNVFNKSTKILTVFLPLADI